MRYKFILFLLLTLKSISIFSQENTDYWYNGIAYTDSTKLTSGVPYLTIALTKEGEQMPKAITVSNSLGVFSFYGVPMNIFKNYTISVIEGNSEAASYLCNKFNEKPEFVGNINAHFKYIPTEKTYSETILTPTKEDAKLLLLDFLKKKLEIEYEDRVLFPKASDSPYKIFANNTEIPNEKIDMILQQVPMEMIKQITVINYKKPNKYFSGVINIRFTVGDEPTIDKETQLFSLPRIK